MLKGAPDAICASPYGLGSDRVRTPSTVNAVPGSKPSAHCSTPTTALLLARSHHEPARLHAHPDNPNAPAAGGAFSTGTRG